MTVNDSVISAEIWRAEVSPCWQDHDAEEPFDHRRVCTASPRDCWDSAVFNGEWLEIVWNLPVQRLQKSPQRILGSLYYLSSLVFFSFNSPRKMSANGTGKRQGPRPRTSSLLCPPPSSSRRTWKVSNCLIPGVFWDGRSWHEWKLGAVLHLELFWGPWWIKWNSSWGKWIDWGGKNADEQFIACQWPMASSKPLFII